MKTILETTRLSLYPYSLQDAPFLLSLVNEPTWLQFIGDRKVYTLEDAERYLVEGSIRSYAEHGFGFWKVTVKNTGVPIGSAGLAKRDYLAEVDLGFAFLPEYTGQGYAYEAAQAIVQYAKDHLHLAELVAFTTKDNKASIKLLEKLGFTYTRPLDLDGEELNVYYILL
jgi:ribosomal-protein-alanine N-acetyltransferase